MDVDYVCIQLLHSRKAETQRTYPETRFRCFRSRRPAGGALLFFSRLHWPRRVDGGKWGGGGGEDDKVVGSPPVVARISFSFA